MRSNDPREHSLRTDPPTPLRDSAAWWIGTLAWALGARDYEAAARADQELQRLGYVVTVRPGRSEVADAC